MRIKGSKTNTKGQINLSIDGCIRLPLKHWIHFLRSSRCPPTSNILSGSERVSSAQLTGETKQMAPPGGEARNHRVAVAVVGPEDSHHNN